MTHRVAPQAEADLDHIWHSPQLCHPERSLFCAKRETNGVEGSRWCGQEQGRCKAFSRRSVKKVRIPSDLNATASARGVLRLRDRFASRSDPCAQDDRLKEMSGSPADKNCHPGMKIASYNQHDVGSFSRALVC